MSASQARLTLGARFKILFVLSSNHLSNSSASYPDTSIFLSFFIERSYLRKSLSKIQAALRKEMEGGARPDIEMHCKRPNERVTTAIDSSARARYVRSPTYKEEFFNIDNAASGAHITSLAHAYTGAPM